MLDTNMVIDYFLSSRSDTVLLPEAVNFDGAYFQRMQDDLVIKDQSGPRAFVRGFFTQANLPRIESADGEVMDGELASAFVKLSPTAVTALLEIDKEQKERPVSH